MVRKLFVAIVFLFISIVFLSVSPAIFAAEEFATSYDVTYEVGTDGVTTVTEKITLKNLTIQYYATQFSLSLGATQISDISATDAGGVMETNLEQKGTSTVITVKFNQQVAGKDKTLPWTLKFRSKDFASQQGKVWQVTVPKIASNQNLESFNLTLSIPLSFGELSEITPQPSSRSTTGFSQIFTFNKEQLLLSGVSASFGKMQVFDFELSFPLQNLSLIAILTSIPIPPDTSFQDVIYQSIDPKPLQVSIDDDGNYLAWYRLERNQKFFVSIKGQAKLYTTSKVKKPTLDNKLRVRYLESDQFWEKDHPLIKAKLSEILGKDPPKTNLEKARLIHRFVANSLKYDTSRVSSDGIERLGAVTALNNLTSAVCMEYADLFIALSRAAGIPARELDGFGYSANPILRPLSLQKDILHAWPEFWDNERGWIMVDPTWESTTNGVDYFNKFDLNHFVFAIKGTSSVKPTLETKDVKVTFAPAEREGKAKIEVTVDAPKKVYSGFPNKLKLKIKNAGSYLAQSSPLLVKAGQVTILGGSIETGPIPAYGEAMFEYDLRTKSLLDNYQETIEILVAGQKYRQEIEVRPFILFRNFPWVLVGLVGIIATIYLTVLAGFIIRRRILKTKLKTQQ